MQSTLDHSKLVGLTKNIELLSVQIAINGSKYQEAK